MKEFIPYGKQYIDDDDIKEVTNAMRSDFLTCGPYVEKFENKLCEVTGAKYTVVCNNGTAALHLSMMALGVGNGDKVIVPTVTFLATANAVRYCGAEVVFADTDSRTGLLTRESLENAYKKAGENVKAVIVVHLCGQLANLSEIKSFCDNHGIKLVEDACHALGGHGVGACNDSDMATFSFHPVKTIAMGEGGAITTNNPIYAKKMRDARNHYMVRSDHWKYSMSDLGYNYRAPDINCALGYSQLKKLRSFVKRRKEIAQIYQEFFKKISWADPVISTIGDEAYHLYPILINFNEINLTKEEFMDSLKEKDIGTQVHYIPVHSQPYYGGQLQDFPNAALFYSKVISLPIFYSLTNDKLNYILEVLDGYS